jgi:aspartate-semialdehyde dehydrogenase
VAGDIVRAAIVGASTLLGKELANELNASASTVWDLKLLDAALADAGLATGQMTSAGDEAMLIQTIEPGAFDGMDIVFFAGDAATTRRHWKEAKAAGAGIVDASAALEAEAVVRCPWVESTDVGAARVVVSAHPAAVMLALMMTRLRARWHNARGIATVMEPASQHGSAGLDEMHQQTVALLSFQAVPKDIYDAQVAFNLSAALGAETKVDLGAIGTRVRRDLRSIAGGEAADVLALQLLQAPVFNGYTASVFVELDSEAALRDIEGALDGGIVSVVAAGEPGPSNLSATEQGQLLVSVRAESDGVRGFWLWMAVDNLKLAAQNATACAVELALARVKQ